MDRLEERRESAFRIQVGGWAMPMVPVQAGPRSERISPNNWTPPPHRIVPAASQNARRDINMLLVPADLRVILGHCFHCSSQYGMLMAKPFDLVAEVSSYVDGFAQVRRHNAKCDRHQAGKYRFLNDDFMLCTFIHSTPSEEYSPSVFSLTT